MVAVLRVARPVPALLLLALAAACTAPEPAVGPAEVERAQEALKPFKGQLLAALLKGLEEGPGGAIEVCSEKAPAIAAGLEKGGVRMGRTSHRLRNPRNGPDPWMEPLLDAYAADVEERPWVAVPLEGGRFGYVEPIRLKPVCLQCHGSQIAPEVAERLSALYPEDQATGFAAGGFRGLFWVTMPRGS